ncbi:helix-turn-helix domain-containing protein (plasmid) [Acuticoccus sp. MNP-M23]|uniref:helix-turn-helix domain-containing protein n=1 Tax=Acuticoccus sp. MNP-M23 TaxID=3072793 RepID=UPI002815BD27|nr:helix-turn-helix domain-containing protein [Acuticoccus sp. MNP-M23]WMS45209.1 helix-turn-helix domain-containing protein [Acuticoccus sp. MNP-M23]
MSAQPLGFAGPADEGQVLGARLKEAREYIGLKQEQVATHLGIPRTGVSDIEKGKRSVSAIELKKLAHLYQRPVQFFTGDDLAVTADVAFLARTASALSDGDRQELQRFAEFLQAKSKG